MPWSLMSGSQKEKKKKRKRKRMGNKGDVSPFIPLEVTSQGVGVCVYNGKR